MGYFVLRKNFRELWAMIAATIAPVKNVRG
jgi:hypothetical protein